MKHIRVTDKVGKKKVFTRAACNVQPNTEDQLVEAALASDCNDCRTIVGVASVNEKTWNGEVIGVRPDPVYDPKPYADLEPLESIRKRRDGR